MSKFDPDDPESQVVRRETLLNDARVREQSRNGDTGTFLSHTHIDDAGGRFAAVNAAKVVVQSPGIAASYPAASAHQFDPCGPEPPLGIDVNQLTAYELEPSLNPANPEPSSPSSVQDTGGAEAPNSPGLSENAAPPPSSSDNHGGNDAA